MIYLSSKMYTLKTEQIIEKPIKNVFEFFKTPENLERLTPDSLNFHFLTPTPITMKEGSIIDYQLSVFFKTIRWTTYITNYDPPYKFSDVQLKGPYSFWHHTHQFESLDQNKTKMIDEVRYQLPFGVFGKIAHTLFVKRQLNDIFNYRKQVLKDILNDI